MLYEPVSQIILDSFLVTIVHMYNYYVNEGENDMPSAPLQTLLTQTPEEGFALAVKLAQKGVEITQPNEEVRKVLRPTYSNDADSLIAVSQVVSVHFQTIAVANNYWRTWTPYY